VLGCLRDSIPNLSRSALHRCLTRHGISRLPRDETASKRSRFTATEIGYVHIDHCELRRALPCPESLAEGITPAELDHVMLLAIPLAGLPAAVKAMTWIDDLTEAGKG